MTRTLDQYDLRTTHDFAWHNCTSSYGIHRGANKQFTQIKKIQMTVKLIMKLKIKPLEFT